MLPVTQQTWIYIMSSTQSNRRIFLQGMASLFAYAGPLQASPPWLPAFQGVYDKDEHGFIPLPIRGVVPDELKGTLYRAGAMRFSSPDGQPYGHWFDGDGGIYAFRLDGSRSAQAAVKIVDSIGLQKEEKKQKRIYTGYGSQAPNALWKMLTNQFKNVANTNVIHMNDELWALVESSKPTRIHPDTLKTLGETNPQNKIKGGFSAHPHRIAGKSDLFNVGLTFGPSLKLHFYHVHPNGVIDTPISIRNPRTPIVHDFALNEQYATVFLPPVSVDLGKVIQHQGAVTKGMSWNQEEGTEIVVIPLAEPKKQIRFRVPAFYLWHVANSFMDGEDIIVDAVTYPNFDSNLALGGIPQGTPNNGGLEGRLTRMRINPKREQVIHTPLCELRCEFPQVNPQYWGQRHQHVVIASFSSIEASKVGIQDQLTLVNTHNETIQTVSLGEGSYTGEAILVPKKSNPKESWVLVVGFQSTSNTSALYILDTESFTNGPIAHIPYDGALPFSFHGHWNPKS